MLLQQKNDGRALQELFQLVQFMSPLVLNPNDVTYLSKVKRATEEFTKVATSSTSEDAHYQHIKQVILDLLNNSTLMEASHLQQMYMTPLMMQPVIPGAIPAGLNQVLPQSSISIGSLAPQVQQHSTHQQAAPHSPLPHVQGHLNVQNHSPRKDMSKSPLRQPGAIELTSDVRKNLHMEDLDRDNDQEQQHLHEEEHDHQEDQQEEQDPYNEEEVHGHQEEEQPQEDEADYQEEGQQE